MKVADDVNEWDIKVSLFNTSGEILLEYQPELRKKRPKPEITVLPKKPEDIETVEELYLAGLRLVQFYDAVVDPQPYFEEALRRDPGNYNVNAFLGMEDVKQKRWKEAEKKLQKAVDRVTYNNTRPKSGEANYYLGLAQKNLGKNKEAYDNLYRATWDYAWNTAGYSQIAEMDFLNGNYSLALKHLDRAISTNGLIKRLQVNKAIALRKLGHFDEAEKMLTAVIEKDVLDFFARNELYILKKQMGSPGADEELGSMTGLMREDEQNYLELATYYTNLGLYGESIDILERIIQSESGSGSENPILYYTLAYLGHLEGNEEKAHHNLESAAKMPWQYCFPWREETVSVLEYAKKANPSDPMASYFLGCLLYSNRPSEAIKEWEYSASMNDAFSYTHRNLAWGYHRHEHNIKKAIESMEKAISLNNQDARFFYEMDQLYEKEGVSVEKRASMLVDNHATVKKRDDALSREALVLLQLGRYDEALEIYEENHFNFWEGVRTVISIFMDANIMRGIQRYNEGDYSGALEDFKMSFAFPPNVDMGKPYAMPRYAEVYYYTGLALEALGDKKEAQEYFRNSVNENADNSIYLYYQGLAYEKLKDSNEAERSFDKLNQFASRERGFEGNTQFSVRGTEQEWLSNKFYATGLYQMAKDNMDEAKESFSQAVDINPHLWASFWLKEKFNQ
jgi:tetratricopeptide (TPR) repeat protein